MYIFQIHCIVQTLSLAYTKYAQILHALFGASYIRLRIPEAEVRKMRKESETSHVMSALFLSCLEGKSQCIFGSQNSWEDRASLVAQ